MSAPGRSGGGFFLPGIGVTAFDMYHDLTKRSVGMSTLDFTWGEWDITYDNLAFGRRYFSRLPEYEIPGGIGRGWMHSNQERLVRTKVHAGAPVADRIYHIDWNAPYLDPDTAYLEISAGSWETPIHKGSRIDSVTTSEWPDAAYRLTFRDGRKHYFDSVGRLLARVSEPGFHVTSFEYAGTNGALSKITDPRGQEYTIHSSSNGYYMTGYTDPMGRTVTYVIDQVDRQLDEVVYPARDVHANTLDGQGQPVATAFGQVTNRQTTREYYYSAGGYLSTILDDTGNVELEVRYQTDDPNNLQPNAWAVWEMDDARGGRWSFEELQSPTRRLVTDPRGFQREYFLDADGRVEELRQHIASIDPAVPSRATNGYHAWQFVRDTGCDCGLLLELIEPDGGSYEFFYSTDYKLERMEQKPNDSSQARRIWSWTYQVDGKVASYAPPEANGAPTPSDFTYYYAYQDLGPADPLAPNGIRVDITQDAGGIRPDPALWVWTYDEQDRLVEYRGPSHDGQNAGDYHLYEYYPDTAGDNAGLLKRHYFREDLSHWTEFTYNANGMILTGETHTGTVFSQEWDEHNNLVRWVGPDRGSQQSKHEWRYDGNGQVSALRYSYYDRQATATGQDQFTWIGTRYWYGPDGRITFAETDVAPGVVALEVVEYDQSGNLARYIDPDGKVAEALYDERDLAWIVKDGVGTAEEAERSISYSPDGYPTSVVDPLDHRSVTMISEYDLFDRLSAFEVQGETRVELKHDAGSRVVETKTFGKSGSTFQLLTRETSRYSDWHSYPTRYTKFVRSEDGTQPVRTEELSVLYMPSGLTHQVLDGSRVIVGFDYLPWGQVSRVYDDGGHAEEFTYEAATGLMSEHVIVQNDPDRQQQLLISREYERDLLGRVVKTIQKATGASFEHVYEYDSLDNLVQATDPLGVVSVLGYRWDGRVSRVDRDYDVGTQTAASSETYTYSPGGLLLTATDNRQGTVTWHYDGRHRPRMEVQPDGAFWAWAYNEGGFLTAATTPTGKNLVYDYNLRGLPVLRTITNAQSALLREDAYTWTLSGHLKEVTKVDYLPVAHTSTVTFTRDSEGLVLLEDQDGIAVQFTRDSKGRATTITAPNSTRSYGFDDYDRITSVHDGANQLIGLLSYVGPTGALSRVDLGSGTRTEIDRDGFSRVASMVTKRGATTMFDFAYGWRDDGNLAYEFRGHESLGDVNRYDDLKRLTNFVRGTVDPVAELANPGSVAHEQARAYDLDADLHRQSVTTTPYQGTPVPVTYQTHPTRHHYTSIGGVSRTMNADGNLLTSGSRTFFYDALDNLIGIRDGGVITATYTYDALGRRKAKTVSGVTTHYLHAGHWVVEEYLSSGGGQPVLEAAHFHAGGVDDILMSRRRDHEDLDNDSDVQDLVDLFLYRNQLGSVMEIVLRSGVPLERYRYDAFGAPRILDAAGNVLPGTRTGNSFLFTGRQYDEESGLYHYRARTYDPSTGAFLQEDPLGLVDGLNPVAYVAGNPVTMKDPFGTSGVGEAVEGLVNFVKENAGLIGDALLDILAPLGALIDAIAAATGYNIRAMVREGFQRVIEMGWWARLKSGASAALNAVGGAVSVLAKIRDVKSKVGALVNAAKAGKKADQSADASRAGSRAAGASPSGCFLAGTLVVLAGSAQAAPIEDVALGAVVHVGEDTPGREDAHLEESWIQCESSAADLLAISFELISPHGERVTGQLLRPQAWLDAWARSGEQFAIELDLVEPGGTTEITGISPVTRLGGLAPGDRHVTGTFLRESYQVLELHLAGVEEPIRTTAPHPFYSATRDEWVPAAHLLQGEQLLTAGGTVEVAQLVHLPGLHRVLNLEVGSAHVFRVSEQGVLVHNSCGRPKGSSARNDPEQAALIEMAKQDQRPGISAGDAQAYKDLGKEAGVPVRGPEAHPNRPHGKNPHIHVGPVDHIPVND